jgi:hypothetical protein
LIPVAKVCFAPPVGHDQPEFNDMDLYTCMVLVTIAAADPTLVDHVRDSVAIANRTRLKDSKETISGETLARLIEIVENELPVDRYQNLSKRRQVEIEGAIVGGLKNLASEHPESHFEEWETTAKLDSIRLSLRFMAAYPDCFAMAFQKPGAEDEVERQINRLLDKLVELVKDVSSDDGAKQLREWVRSEFAMQKNSTMMVPFKAALPEEAFTSLLNELVIDQDRLSAVRANDFAPEAFRLKSCCDAVIEQISTKYREHASSTVFKDANLRSVVPQSEFDEVNKRLNRSFKAEFERGLEWAKRNHERALNSTANQKK